MLVVMMLMTASSAMAEVIDGIRYLLESDTKTATLLPKMEGKYSGDIIIPEKVKSNDSFQYGLLKAVKGFIANRKYGHELIFQIYSSVFRRQGKSYLRRYVYESKDCRHQLSFK